MIIVQAVPPQIPSPPFDPNLLFMNHGPAVVMVILAALVTGTIVLWPLARALAHRLEGRGPSDVALRTEVEQLHQRLAELDAVQQRVAELEERVDFAERLLARGPGASAPLERGGP
jgi:Tfp pilus assembly protein PilO